MVDGLGPHNVTTPGTQNMKTYGMYMVLCYKSEVCWFDPSLQFFIDIILPIALWRPGVDSASNRNEYQEHFLGVKAACA